jgi:hypothetical protein
MLAPQPPSKVVHAQDRVLPFGEQTGISIPLKPVLIQRSNIDHRNCGAIGDPAELVDRRATVRNLFLQRDHQVVHSEDQGVHRCDVAGEVVADNGVTARYPLIGRCTDGPNRVRRVQRTVVVCVGSLPSAEPPG